MHLNNSFISTTMCDDLARATEAQDGKKRGESWVSALLSRLFCWTPSQDLAVWSGVVPLFLCKIS